MSDDLACARARVAADDWLARKEREVPRPPKITLPRDGFRVFMLEAFMAGAAWSDDAFDDQRREGQRQLDDATALMTEAVSMLRETEALHRRHAAMAGATPGPVSMAERNALMAARLEAWLAGDDRYPVSLDRPGSMSPDDQAAQEEFVSAALDDGVDLITEADEPPFADRTLADCKARFHEGGFVKGPGLRADEVPALLSPGGRLNPIDVLREVAEGMVDGEVIKGVDGPSFDRAREYLAEPVQISAIDAPTLADPELKMLKERRDATMTQMERERTKACADAGFIPWYGGDSPPADLDPNGEVLLDWGPDSDTGPRFTICSVKELTPMPGLWEESIDLESFATIIGYSADPDDETVIEHPAPISTERVHRKGQIVDVDQEIKYEAEGEGLDLTRSILINGVRYIPAKQFDYDGVLAEAETLIREASDFIRGVTGANPGSDSEEMCQRLDQWPTRVAIPAADEGAEKEARRESHTATKEN